MPPNVAVGIELSDEERVQLEAWTRRRTSSQALAQRSRIVLLAAAGLKNTEIAERLAISRSTAAIWRARFAEHRLDGLLDEPRPGRPRTITDEQVEAVLVATLALVLAVTAVPGMPELAAVPLAVLLVVVVPQAILAH